MNQTILEPITETQELEEAIVVESKVETTEAKIETRTINGREVPCIEIKNYLFPDDIPVPLWADLIISDLTPTEKLWKLHKFACPDSQAIAKEFDEAFWLHESLNLLNAYKL
jgi:hypothetical protein